MHRSLQIRKQAARAKLRKLRPMGLLRLPRAYHPDAMPFELTSYCLKTLNDFKWQSYTEKHKAGRAALGLSCVACIERSVGVFADRGASKIMMFQESLYKVFLHKYFVLCRNGHAFSSNWPISLTVPSKICENL